MTQALAKSTLKTTKAYLKCASFYNQHFPTDKRTFNVRFPVLGLVLSLCSLNLIASIVLDDFFRTYASNLIIYAYLLLATGVALELYWGLKIGDRKQYTPWIVLKIVEIIALIVSIGSGIFNHRFYYLYDKEVKGVYSALTLFFNCLMLYIVIVKSLKHLTCNVNLPKEDDDHLDDFRQEARTYDNV